MSRWKPDARGRLEQAAYELFRDRGYDQITVADIAERAGLTERTFFRHYADKREVLFGGGATILRDELLRALGDLPSPFPTIEVVRTGIEAIAALMRGRQEFARERQRIVNAHADLQERELIKRATLTSTLARALQQRGVREPSARIAAEMGMAVFYVGFGHWLDDTSGRELVEIVRQGFEEVKAIASGA